MTQSSIASATVRPSDQSSNGVRVIVTETAAQEILDVLNDADCRAILGATSEQALTASEVSEIHDLSQSTTYRKLGLLTEAGLLEERTRIRQSGKHPSEYTRLVDDVAISLRPRGETEVWLSR